jgi:hypothetical protein
MWAWQALVPLAWWLSQRLLAPSGACSSARLLQPTLAAAGHETGQSLQPGLPRACAGAPGEELSGELPPLPLPVPVANGAALMTRACRLSFSMAGAWRMAGPDPPGHLMAGMAAVQPLYGAEVQSLNAAALDLGNLE